MSDEKYIVFKREDFEKFTEFRNIFDEALRYMERHAVPDAVVIRCQDAFAAPALHTYANSIAVAARAIGELAPSTRDRLQGVADYFHERAEYASDVKTKLPD